MKGRRFSFWRWCPHPERMKSTRTRPTDRPWVPLVASALILSLLAMQGIQMWMPSAVNANYLNSYDAVPVVQPAQQPQDEIATASEATAIISSDHVTVQFIFPESADPGKTVTVSTVTTAKANMKVNDLTIEVFIYVDKQLTRAGAATVLKDKKIRSGDTWQTTLTVIIPLNAQRSAMIGTVAESWEETASYYYSPYSYWAYYPYYPYPPYPSYPYNYTVFYVYEPSYVVTEKSSKQTVPLTYVLATTPEYEALLAKHQQLQQDYDSLVAKHNELSSKYESLRADYDQIVSKYNAATQELNNFRNLTYTLLVVSVVLAAALALLFMKKQATRPPKKDEE